ncbi:MAG: hypothetical protein MZV65_02470 [Chromatiales bacterium]|nr:hypothetical protein [Chromatiales bacterium]
MNAAIAEHWRHVAPILARPASDADLDQKIAHLDSLLAVGAEQEGLPAIRLGRCFVRPNRTLRIRERFAGYGKATGLDALKFMMAEHGLTQADLRESRNARGGVRNPGGPAQAQSSASQGAGKAVPCRIGGIGRLKAA